ncbi:hypothetical protein DFR52_101107 [Hoeflea marina]|uniref:Hemerythrin HHE cation binding domain-containing protein n=1 Tax=Hoeflea marina TaxID=274592 RepID=A0A317PR68_9HYPH|nr:hypothetical protein [Hoeflea marina]PWW03427.1 hypothetical protein DFR52_101107 [Hoeflea marina]
MNQQARIGAPKAAKEDLYYAIHKGIRFANARMLIALGALDAEDDDAVLETLTRLHGHLEMSLAHLNHENHFIHTAIDERYPGGSDHAGDDHDHHLNAFAELRRLSEDLSAAVTDRAGRLRRLYQRFALFVSADLAHMHEEETELMPLIEANFTQEEIADLHRRLVASIPPADMVPALRAMLGGASPAERVAMVTGMEMAMPAEAFAGLMAAITGSAWRTGDWTGLERAVC